MTGEQQEQELGRAFSAGLRWIRVCSRMTQALGLWRRQPMPPWPEIAPEPHYWPHPLHCDIASRAGGPTSAMRRMGLS